MSVQTGTFLIQDEYLIRRKFLKFLGATFDVFDSAGKLLLTSRQKAFRLKEDIRIYRDQTLAEEVLLIRARKVIDFSAAYDVVDVAAGAKIGALRRKGFRSLVRDSWEFLDADDRPVAQLQEDSMALALIRRFLLAIIPQSFHVERDGRSVATLRQRFNPFLQKLDVKVLDSSPAGLDPRLALAAGILIVAIEGRQRS